MMMPPVASDPLGPQRIPIIIDTDPGVDDCLAILLALASPELDILAIVCTFGNTDVDSGLRNVLKIFSTLERHLDTRPEDRTRFPGFSKARRPMLVRGAAGPLEGETRSAKYFHGRDGLSDITTRHPELTFTSSSEYLNILPAIVDSPSFIAQLVADRPPHSVTYAALGPLTTLVNVCRADAAFGARLGRVVSMGGAIDVPGNTTPAAEFNVFADPFAARCLFTSTEALLPLDRFTLLPLDITTSHCLGFASYARHVDTTFVGSTGQPSTFEAHSGATNGSGTKTLLVHFTSSILERTAEKMRSFGYDELQLHDPAAIWYCLEHPSAQEIKDSPGWTVDVQEFEVERFGEHTRGMLVADRRRGRQAYGAGADRSKVEAQRDATGNETLMTETARGVRCVKRTPGPELLEKMLLERVWGVRLP